jgi:hypothetical protein
MEELTEFEKEAYMEELDYAEELYGADFISAKVRSNEK